MTDWTAVALRFAIYADLMLLFGLAAYDLYAGRPARSVRSVALATLAALGIVLSAAGFLVTTASMAGLAVSELDRDTLSMVLLETPIGTAAIVRAGALLIAALAAIRLTHRTARQWPVAAVSAVALATLAWSGHGAMDEGTAGTIHLVADIVHLLAAAAWTGALAILLSMILRPLDNAEAFGEARSALAGFAIAGSAIVALVLVSGLVNGWVIVGPENLSLLPSSLYGQLLIAKLLLFMAMLGLAAANRWLLTPRIEAGLATDDLSSAVRRLRASIAFEAGAATVIVALVAWLGTLSPPSTGM